MRWYDACGSGQPKPFYYVTRFLASYLTSSTAWTSVPPQGFHFEITPANRSLPTPGLGLAAAFTFQGPDCLFLGGASFTNGKIGLEFESHGTGPSVVMSYWNHTKQGIALQASTDAAIRIQPQSVPFEMPFGADEIAIGAAHGGAANTNPNPI